MKWNGKLLVLFLIALLGSSAEVYAQISVAPKPDPNSTKACASILFQVAQKIANSGHTRILQVFEDKYALADLKVEMNRLAKTYTTETDIIIKREALSKDNIQGSFYVDAKKKVLLGGLPQDNLRMDQLGEEDQALVKLLLALEVHPELIDYAHKEFEKKFGDALKLHGAFPKSLLEGLMGHIPVYTEVLYNKGIELGAYRLIFESGKIATSIITSFAPETVLGEGILEGLLADNKDEKLLSIQFFHNHPGGGPLTDRDLTIIWYQKIPLSNKGFEVPFHAYAVSYVGNAIKIFHRGER